MMNEFYASTLTNEQLRKEILSKGRKANLRLAQLRKTGLYELNPLIGAKWKTFLQTNKFATKAGYFKTGSKGENRAVLLKQYLQIRQFLGQQTSVKDTRRIIANHAARLGVDEDTAIDTLKLYGSGDIPEIVNNSDVQQSIIKGYSKFFGADYEQNKDLILERLGILNNSKKANESLYDIIRNDLRKISKGEGKSNSLLEKELQEMDKKK